MRLLCLTRLATIAYLVSSSMSHAFEDGGCDCNPVLPYECNGLQCSAVSLVSDNKQTCKRTCSIKASKFTLTQDFFKPGAVIKFSTLIAGVNSASVLTVAPISEKVQELIKIDPSK